MNYTQALAFLRAEDAPGIRPGLSRVRTLLEKLGSPQDRLRCVHIAGTNGKGSVAVMLAAVLQAAGYRVGLLTSPYLVRFNEQICINGEEISDQKLSDVLEQVRAAAEDMEEKPSSFERFVPAAFLSFAEARCDIVVLETGMGGRLDATNVISFAETEIITRIAMDHTAYLGDTIGAIAGEKAGIIKPGTDVVMIRQQEEIERVIRTCCDRCGARLHLTDPACLHVRDRSIERQVFDYRARTALELSLTAVWQTENAAAVLDAVDVLLERGWSIPDAAVRKGLGTVRWPARFEVLHREPLVLLDGAHNADGTEALAASLRDILPGGKAVFVMGVLADKDYRRMIDLMAPFAERFIATSPPDNPRALPADVLLRELRKRTPVPSEMGGSMETSLKKALDCTPADGAICIFGSLYQAGAARACFLKSVFSE